jgi:hypothetical protein
MQTVILKELKPNPFRDFRVDPIDEQSVEALVQSIKQDGFWSGVVARQVNGHYQIGCGHTRVQAAIKAGYKTAEIYVGALDDAAMVRIMARENATQRGDFAAASAGSIAAALRLVAKALLAGHHPTIVGWSEKAFETARGNLTSGKGIGEEVILGVLKDVPKMSTYVIKEQLANLKASGDYARIIRDVTEEIKQEEAQRLKDLERAEREARRATEEADRAKEARRKANESFARAKQEAERKLAEAEAARLQLEAERKERYREEIERELRQFDALRQKRDRTEQAAAAVNGSKRTFDFAGVSKYLKNDHQIKAFRQLVTSETVNVPVEAQAALAQKLVEAAKAGNQGEVSAAFIRGNLQALISGARRAATKLSREEEERLRAEDAQVKFKFLQEEFGRNIWNVNKHGQAILKLLSENRGVNFTITHAFRQHVKYAQETINKLADNLNTL